MLKPWSKLKKPLDNLFVPELKAQFYCISYPIRGERKESNAIPRFYFTIGKQIVWDFPKNFEPLIEIGFFCKYSRDNKVTRLIREYIDTPVEELLQKEFEDEKIVVGKNRSKTFMVDYHLIELFIAADRRIGKAKLLEFAKSKANERLDYIIEKRFNPVAITKENDKKEFPKFLPIRIN